MRRIFLRLTVLFAVVVAALGAGAAYIPTQHIDPRQAPYFCAGDGVTDDTSCMASVLTAAGTSGATVSLGPHMYKISSLLSPANAVAIEGTNASAPNICLSGFLAAAANISIISLPASSLMRNVCIQTDVSGVNTSGTAVAALSGYVRIYDSFIFGACNGLDLSGNSLVVDHVRLRGGGGGASCNQIIIGRTTTAAATVDPRITNVTVDANTGNPPASCQLIYDAGGLYEENNDMLYCSQGTVIQPQANQVVSWAFFNNTVLGDTTPSYSLAINANAASAGITGLHFNNSWTSSVAGGDAIQINDTGGGIVDGINFVGHRIVNVSNGNGLYIHLGTNIAFSDGFICGLNTNQNGVVIAAAASRVKVTNNTIGKNCLALSVFSGATGTTGVASLSGVTTNHTMVLGNDLSQVDTPTSGVFTVNDKNM